MLLPRPPEAPGSSRKNYRKVIFLHFALARVPEAPGSFPEVFPEVKIWKIGKALKYEWETMKNIHFYRRPCFREVDPKTKACFFVSSSSDRPFLSLTFPGRFPEASRKENVNLCPWMGPRGRLIAFFYCMHFVSFLAPFPSRGFEPPFPAPFPCHCKPAFRKRPEAPGRVTGSKKKWSRKW